MNKEEYKTSLRRHYPTEPEEVLELAWHFHSVEKAKRYIALLETCNHNADLALKVVRKMYVSCDVDAVKAVSEKFIKTLLPFTCMEKSARPHSVAYHIRNMLGDDQVKAERKAEEERLRQIRLIRQEDDTLARTSGTPARTADVTIQIQFRTDNEEFIRQIMMLAAQSNAVFVKVEEHTTETTGFPSGPIFGYFAPKSIFSRDSDLYRLAFNIQDMPLTLLNLRSIFGDEEPEVTCRSLYNKKGVRMTLDEVQRWAMDKA